MPHASGIVLPIDFSSEQTLVLDEYLRQVFVNETPALARLDREQGTSESFGIISYDPRPLTATYVSGANSVAPAAGTVEVWTFSDASYLLVGDVLLFGTTEERVEVTVQSVNGTTASVRRGVAGTAPLAGASVPTAADAIKLVGNARFGNEVDQVGIRAPRTTATQYHQRSLLPVQVGGRVMDLGNIVGPRAIPGLPQVVAAGSDPLSQLRAEQLVNLMRLTEVGIFLGKAQAATATSPSKAGGAKYLIKSSNVVTSPTTPSAYTPDSLVTDLFQKVFDSGGQVDVCFMSTGWMSGLHKWGFAKNTNFNLGVNRLGSNISGYVLPFHGRDVTFIPAPLLNLVGSHTIVGFTSEEVKMSVIRAETWEPRARRGDAFEGDWILDAALKLINPGHHGWVQGVTGFSI